MPSLLPGSELWKVNLSGLKPCLENKWCLQNSMGIDTSAFRHFMKKKLADTLDRNREPVNKGDYVFFNRYRGGFGGNSRSRPYKILGKVKKVDGAYIYVQNAIIKQDVSELYSAEIWKASQDEAALWMLEN